MFGLYRIRTCDLMEVKDLFLSHARSTKLFGIIHKLFLHSKFLIPYESNKKCKSTTWHMSTWHATCYSSICLIRMSLFSRAATRSKRAPRPRPCPSSLVVLMQVCYNDWNVGECFLQPQPKVAETNFLDQKRFRMGRYSLFALAKAWTSVLLMS